MPSPDKVEYLADAADLGRAYQHQLLVSLDLRPGDTVLDVGCGPGTGLSVMADAVTTSGRSSARTANGGWPNCAAATSWRH